MKKTALFERHLGLGARMEEYGGYEMPIQFSRIQDEHMAVRSKAGIFDVSHMGEILVEGKGALEFMERLTTNRASAIETGQAQYTLLLNESGGVVDDLLVYRLNDQRYMLVVNAANTEKDLQWILSCQQKDVTITDLTPETGLIAIQGPRSSEILSRLTQISVEEIPFYHFRTGPVAGIDSVLISATGYTGSGGFELYVKSTKLVKLWDALMEVGESKGLLPAGLGARDTLRLEMGYLLYGQDMDEDTSPLEAGLGWIVKLDKDDFIGKDSLIKQKSNGLVTTLKGFGLDTKRVPRTGFSIFDKEEQEIGKVTSGTFSPCLEKSIGLGYFQRNKVKIGMEVLVYNGKKYFEGRLVNLPFVNVKEYVSRD